MSASIGGVKLIVRVTSNAQPRGASLAREVRSMLPDALTAAVTHAASGPPGVVLVPRVNVSMRGALRRLRGGAIARRLAAACIDAAAKRSRPVDLAAGGEGASTAQRIVEMLRSGESVRCRSLAEAAAAWLVALVRDEPGMLLTLAPFADLRHRSSGAAFAQICARVDDSNAVVRALGRRWSLLFAARCTEAEAGSVLRGIPAGDEPAPETWAFVADRLAASHDRDAASYAGRLLKAAIDGMFDRRPGIVAAARSLLAATAPKHAAGAPQPQFRASNLCGVWLLWPHLAPYLGDVDERGARALALALGEYLGGAFAAGDPALEALCREDESLRDLRAAVPPEARIERLAVSVVRDFSLRLTHFERARCGYVLRAILSGPGSVIRSGGEWRATLPHSPLRIVLERAAVLGPLRVPWQSPRLTLVRDDG
jgi:hypothetical protein